MTIQVDSNKQFKAIEKVISLQWGVGKKSIPYLKADLVARLSKRKWIKEIRNLSYFDYVVIRTVSNNSFIVKYYLNEEGTLKSTKLKRLK